MCNILYFNHCLHWNCEEIPTQIVTKNSNYLCIWQHWANQTEIWSWTLKKSSWAAFIMLQIWRGEEEIWKRGEDDHGHSDEKHCTINYNIHKIAIIHHFSARVHFISRLCKFDSCVINYNGFLVVWCPWIPCTGKRRHGLHPGMAHYHPYAPWS